MAENYKRFRCPFTFDGDKISPCQGLVKEIDTPEDGKQWGLLCEDCEKQHPVVVYNRLIAFGCKSADMQDRIMSWIQRKKYFAPENKHLCASQAFHLWHNPDLQSLDLVAPRSDCENVDNDNQFCDKCKVLAEQQDLCYEDGIVKFRCPMAMWEYDYYEFRDDWEAAENCEPVKGKPGKVCTKCFNNMIMSLPEDDMEERREKLDLLEKFFEGDGYIKELKPVHAVRPAR
jgi:hypothetical protein